jgi:two-component system, cell cycle sensor histidine kinase and response regulator CckA
MSTAVLATWTQQDRIAEFHAQFEKAPFGMAQCQCERSITAVNPALEEMLGAGRASQGICLVDLIHAPDSGHCERLISELFGGKRDSFQIESTSEGGTPPLRWRVWRVPGANQTTNYVLAMVHEVATSLADPRAGRLEAVGRLAGGVAHDFNNLLTGILLYCDLLMASIEPGHRARKYAAEIRKAGMQATGLVRQLLAIARPQNSQPQLLSLNELAEGMRNLLVRLIGENLELQFRLDPKLGLIKLDPTQAQQILLNLVINARDAMPRGGQITVETHNCWVEALTKSRLGASTQASLPCALFVVEDNGLGMDASTRAHLFEPFFTTKGGKGTGLGLATVHDIVNSNGGLIHVGSEPARGTRISVLLPLAPESVLGPPGACSFHPAKNGDIVSSKEEE